ncbi:MAG: MarR family transcriptional regulator [Desulfobacteraceae bacterium]|nr:MAG: MarR family transcriptional regulator [Desulfobacteraceae bacterium]
MFESFAFESIPRRLVLLFRMTMKHLRLEMKEIGAGTGDYSFIAILFLKDGLSQDELSTRMQVDKSYTARAVARLEQMDLVERRPDPQEHRVKRVFLGQRAKDMKAEIFTVFKHWHDTLVRGIDPEDLPVIRQGLDQMIENACRELDLETWDDIIFKGKT